jgi:hypothetical protein
VALTTVEILRDMRSFRWNAADEVCLVFVFKDKVATQLSRPEIWEKMDEEVARRADEERIRRGSVDSTLNGEKDILHLEK